MQPLLLRRGVSTLLRQQRAAAAASTTAVRHCSGAADLPLSGLTAISSIDGRYGRLTKDLRPVFSEFALIQKRVLVEVEWLKLLSELEGLPEVAPLSADSRAFLDTLASDFTLENAKRVKAIERETNHDVKAVEYFLKEAVAGHAELAGVAEFFHFSCTSEDINNLAYALMLRDARDTVLLPAMDEVIEVVSSRAEEFASLPLLARTHGQPATPTTLGKELANFAYRLHRQRSQFAAVEVSGKLNGAVGNFAAHQVVCPELDWPALSQSFVTGRLGLAWNPYSTQIEPHDGVAEMCDAGARYNTVLLDMARDVWGYVSLGYFRQRVVANEVGSSTMPHKVNPIDFENAEGNIGLANASLGHLSAKLPVSRFQRDLSDSTVMRTLGSGFAHSLIAYKSTLKGLGRVDPNIEVMEGELDRNWEVLAEPVQTVMRRLGRDAPYEQLKALTRGQKVDAAAMKDFIVGLELPEAEEARLLALTPLTYIGESVVQARSVREWCAKYSVPKP